MKVKVFHHDNCFDGLASAAVFTKFYKSKFSPDAEFAFEGLAHKAKGQNFEVIQFDGDENVIVDFKYYNSDKLTWWFDHHQSAFQTQDDEAHFRQDKSGRKFLNPEFKSCTKLIATVATDRFGFNPNSLSELIHWADTIDGAQYADPQTAVDIRGPAMQLLVVIEASKDRKLLNRLIVDLQQKSLDKIASSKYISKEFEPLYQRHLQALEVIRKRARFDGTVTFFDVTDTSVEGYNKFIPYYLHPASVYSVGISRQSPTRVKVSVGFNPWSPQPRVHNLASISERYGGGGHAVVSAISYEPRDLAVAQKTAAEIVKELHG